MPNWLRRHWSIISSGYLRTIYLHQIQIGDNTLEFAWEGILEINNPHSVIHQHSSLLESVKSLENDLVVVILLIAELYQGIHSYWYNYIITLPKSYNSTSYWNDNEIEELQGSIAFEKTKNLKNVILEQFELHFYPLAQVFNLFSSLMKIRRNFLMFSLL